MKKIILLLFLFYFIPSIYSQNIPRKAFLGLRLIEINDSIKTTLNLSSKEGLIVINVSPNSTGEKMGLKINDIIESINDIKLNSVKEYREAVKNYREKTPVKFEVNRTGEKLMFNGEASPLPFEKSDKYDVIYDEVKFKEGYLRIITTKPKTTGKFKTILFIPGYLCYSLDNIGKHPYGQLVDKLSERGYSVVRVEKPGTGDCYNTPDCIDIDYNTELEAFEAGFQKMLEYDFVDKDNVFIFGHSLGGYEAPMVDKNRIAKGVIACGTGLKTWYEYIIEMFRFQNPITGVDYIENEKVVQDMIKVLYDYLVLKKHPKDLAIGDELKKEMKEYIEYSGGDQVWSRNYKFWQQLQDLNMAEVWKSVNANVLIIRGEGDFEAFSNKDHEDIVNIVNAYHPGKGKFLLIPNMDHGFATSKTPEESYANTKIAGYYYNNFNPAIIDEVSKWIE
jgi:pimeloyl-ACP methyl ester carboxylesterase